MYGRVIGMRFADWKAWYAQKGAEIKAAQKAAQQATTQLQAQQGQ
jgi:hypothetical protein